MEPNDPFMACVVSTTTSTMAQFDFLADPESEQQGNRRGSSAGGAGISTIPSVSDNDESLSDVDADVADLVSIRDEELEDVSSLVDQFATARGRRGRAHRGPPRAARSGGRGYAHPSMIYCRWTQSGFLPRPSRRRRRRHRGRRPGAPRSRPSDVGSGIGGAFCLFPFVRGRDYLYHCDGCVSDEEES